ncbi:FAS-associated factor 1 [Phlebotomus papatasi]|nr:FAS-associated factor 1 [Phlebotomus papatasi]
MAENREETLANFQNITAIDDVGEAIYLLEESNWDLLTAIHKVIPQDDPPMENPPPYSVASSSMATEKLNLNNLDVTSNSSVEPMAGTPSSSLPVSIVYNIPATNSRTAGPSTSSNNGFFSDAQQRPKDVNFTIHFNNRMHNIVISDHATMGELKTRIYEATNVPPCRQALKGFMPFRHRDAQNAQAILKNLNVARDNVLDLTDLTDLTDDGDSPSRLNETFNLNINIQPEGRTIPLKYPGSQTILEVKSDVFSITDIAVRHQVWLGWPDNVSNDTSLAQSGIDLEHNLVLKSAESSSSKKSQRQMRSNNSTIELDSESSMEEYEDASEDFNADDDLFAESPPQNRLNYLMPDQVSDEIIGSIEFVQNYIQRYGEPHPEFYQGTLSDALAEACHKPAKDRKLLAIYLHHDSSVLTNVFCGQLLSCESIIQTLMHNFILYGWDLTFESNKNMFLSAITGAIGTPASITVRNIPIDRLPAILIISKSRSNCEVFSVIHGNVGVDDLLSQLMESIDLYTEQQRVEIREESERAAREQVLMEQDMAYRESLEADRAKEEAKKRREQMLATERKRLESEKAEQEARRIAIRLEAERTLPAEPDANHPAGVTKIRVRKPSGDFLERRFTADTKLNILLNYITSVGFPVAEYKMFSGWPRKDLTTMNTEDTLKNLRLCPQETVILEER